MINKLINLANYLDESSFKKEADQVDGIIKNALAPLGPIAIEKLIATSPVWAPPAKSAGISIWIWVAGILGVGAVGAGVTYNQAQAEEEEAKRRVLLLEKIYNREVMSQNMAGGMDPDLDSDELKVYFAPPRPEDIKRWYETHPNKEEIDEELEGGEVVWLPDPPPAGAGDTDYDLDMDLDLDYEEEEDTSPLDCHFLCWAEQIKGSGGLFSYHFMYNYTDMMSEVRDILSRAILMQNYSLIKKALLPLEIGRDDGILSSIHPSAFKASFKASGLEKAVCTLCPGDSYNIVYLSDTHKPKETIEYDYNNKLLNMSEERVHHIYFDPMLIKNTFPIMGNCRPTDGLRLVR
jgi:hypothetical protein